MDIYQFAQIIFSKNFIFKYIMCPPITNTKMSIPLINPRIRRSHKRKEKKLHKNVFIWKCYLYLCHKELYKFVYGPKIYMWRILIIHKLNALFFFDRKNFMWRIFSVVRAKTHQSTYSRKWVFKQVMPFFLWVFRLELEVAFFSYMF